MKFSTSAAFLSFLKVALCASVDARAASDIKAVTLDIVNGQVAPDGFQRSTLDSANILDICC